VPDLAALQALAAMVDWPEGVVWAVSGPADPAGLFPVERQAIARAVPARQAEFAGGRDAARAALAQLGLPPQPIPKGADRAPVWPEGVVASLSHTAGLCVAVAARARDWRGLGVDLERALPLDPGLVPTIASPAELDRLAPLEPGLAALHVFGAKEAAYKAQYPLTRSLFGFAAMEALLPDAGLRMVAATGLGQGAKLPMRQWRNGGLLLSLCALPQVNGGDFAGPGYEVFPCGLTEPDGRKVKV
jgi:enterobactin synthetase component D